MQMSSTIWCLKQIYDEIIHHIWLISWSLGVTMMVEDIYMSCHNHNKRSCWNSKKLEIQTVWFTMKSTYFVLRVRSRMIVYKIVRGPDKNHTSVHPYLTTSSVSQKDFSAFRTAHSTSKLVDSSFWKVPRLRDVFVSSFLSNLSLKSDVWFLSGPLFKSLPKSTDCIRSKMNGLLNSVSGEN